MQKNRHSKNNSISFQKLSLKTTEKFPVLWEGGCHIVYDTKDGNVLKKPKWIWRLLCNFDVISEDVQIATKYLGDYIWPTTVMRDIKSPNGYTIVQPILPTNIPLTLDILEKSPKLREQFDDFLNKNEILYTETGRAFDFFGLEWMIASLVAKEEIKETENVIHIFQKIFRQLVVKVFIWKDDIGEDISITNLLFIEQDGIQTIRVVDPTLTNERSMKMEDKTFAYCCNSLNRKYMKKFFKRDILIQSIK